MSLDWILDNGYLPNFLIRMGIRRQLGERITEITTTSHEAAYETKMEFISKLRTQPIAIKTATANEQHYEVSTEVMSEFLGPRMKYSSGLYPSPRTTLAEAETAMLELYIERAEVKDGMNILDLGCGWGSVTLFLAEKFPNARVTGLSNSSTQKVYIDQQARERGLGNVTVITADIVDYEFTAQTYDRIITIECFEHMKNYRQLLAKVSGALNPGGKLFVHIFAHKDAPYHFEEGWMTRHFFGGGTMPSADLLLYFQEDLLLSKQWWVSGKHYARTCEDWLSTMTRNKRSLIPHLIDMYGKEGAATWYSRWQIFFMACAELFGYAGGDTWGVCHYLFDKTANQ